MPASATVPDPRFLVVDGLFDVSVAHGLARITLAQAGPDGDPVPAGRIAVPLARLPAVAGGFLTLMRKLAETAKEADGAEADSLKRAQRNVRAGGAEAVSA